MEESEKKISITVFTDPLCCWSWAFEEQLQHLKIMLNGKATWDYRMGGLIPSWNNFKDNLNAVSRPAQMGPVWMHAGQIANRPIYHQQWINDPPASSYPACIAVKCAQLQSPVDGNLMLHLLRDACMTNGKNIALQDTLFDVAAKITVTNQSFDLIRFKEDYLNGAGMEAFRADLELVGRYRINRFPALIVSSAASKPFIIAGYRKYEDILKTITSVCKVTVSSTVNQ